MTLRNCSKISWYEWVTQFKAQHIRNNHPNFNLTKNMTDWSQASIGKQDTRAAAEYSTKNWAPWCFGHYGMGRMSVTRDNNINKTQIHSSQCFLKRHNTINIPFWPEQHLCRQPCVPPVLLTLISRRWSRAGSDTKSKEKSSGKGSLNRQGQFIPAKRPPGKKKFAKTVNVMEKAKKSFISFWAFFGHPHSFPPLPHVQAMQRVAYTLSGQLCASLYKAMNIKMAPSERTNPWKEVRRLLNSNTQLSGGIIRERRRKHHFLRSDLLYLCTPLLLQLLVSRTRAGWIPGLIW